MSQEKRTVGILGGMGPEATALILSRVIAMTEVEDDIDHVPLLIDNNPQVPSRIKAIIEKTGEDPTPILINMAQKLEASGVKALAMPCNTAHWYADAIQASVNIPFLHMIDLALEKVLSMPLKNKRVGILGSPAVKMTGLFDKVFSKESIECIYPDDQDNMLEAIKLIKKDKDNPQAHTTLRRAARELAEKSVDAQLIACSEFSIITHVIPNSVVYIDTIDVLAKAIIQFSNSSQ